MQHLLSKVERILEISRELNALQFGEFQLSSGAKSHYYFDGRLLTLHPEGARAVAEVILPITLECGANFIAGPTLGADPIVSAVSLLSQILGERLIPAGIIRKEQKEHGTTRLIEGPMPLNAKVLVVDDTCTSGRSLFHAINVLESENCEIVKVVSILDRREGGHEKFQNSSYSYISLLEADGYLIRPSSEFQSNPDGNFVAT